MNLFDRSERIVLERGKLCRVVTAHGIGKMKGRQIDVAKIYEDGKQYCRNIDYRPIAGYVVEFPRVTYKGWNGSYKGRAYKFSKCFLNITNISYSSPDENDKQIFLQKYPEFKWIFQKSALTNSQYFHLLPFWKQHPQEVEILLANGYTKLALDGRLWKAKDRKPILEWIKENRTEENACLEGIRVCVKFGCSYSEWRRYRNVVRRGYYVEYDVFKYLESSLQKKETLYGKIRTYRDYIEMAKEAGHNIKEKYWRFPKNLKSAHDKVLREVTNIRALREKEKDKEKEKNYIKAVTKWNGKEVTLSNGVRVYVPQSIEDIVKQAEALKQCLIASDYVKKVIEKKCLLVFIRNKEKPLATAEILPGNKIGQFYGNEANVDRCAPPKKAKEAMEIFKRKFLKKKKAA